MAKKKVIGPAPKNDAELAVRIVLDPTDDTPSHYVNYAEVNFSSHEFTISFVKVPTRVGATQTEALKTSGTLLLEPSVQVILPPTVIPGLQRALTTSRQKYEEKMGQIKDPGAENE